MNNRPARWRVVGSLMLVTAGAVEAAPPDPGRPVSRLSAVQAAYLTSCGGCHGVEGVSAPHSVPTLRHLTGQFLCTAEGRAFLIRLPDVGLSSLSDRMLARVMNFVVFDMGAPVPSAAQARPYSAAEVGRLRRRALTGAGLTAYRNRVVEDVAAHCPVAAQLRVYGEGVRASVGRHR